jgi:predicted phage-related endonuclease
MLDTTNEPVELDNTVAHWLNAYRDIQAQIKDLEEKLAVARGHIEEALGDHAVGTVNGQPAVRWSWVTSRRFDQKIAKELLDPAQLHRCMMEQNTRRFELVREQQ